MDWYRFYNETPEDAKLRRAARQLNTSAAEVIGTWATIMCFASVAKATTHQVASRTTNGMKPMPHDA